MCFKVYEYEYSKRKPKRTQSIQCDFFAIDLKPGIESHIYICMKNTMKFYQMFIRIQRNPLKWELGKGKIYEKHNQME